MKKLFHVAFVNANGVAIRIENHPHAANGRLDRFDEWITSRAKPDRS